MHEYDSRTAELLAEELTSDEVRHLLERLNVRAFGGAENVTVGAIVEATGSDPLVIGGLLGEIRKEDFQERFGIRLDHHEKRIETLETQSRQRITAPERTRSSASTGPALDQYQQAALDRLAEAERLKPLRNVAIGVAAATIVALALLKAGRAPSAPSSTPYPTWEVTTDAKDGTVHLDSNGKIWVQLKGGGERKATPEEDILIRLMAPKK